MATKATIEIDIKSSNATQNIDKVNDSVKSLKTQLRESILEIEKLSAAEIVDQEALDEAILKSAELRDRIADTNEQINIFAAGSKYERVSNAFGEIRSAIANLDFEKAQDRAGAFAKAASAITFKDAIGSVKQLGSTFMTLGKALLANPLFLIAAVIAGIVAAVVKLLDKIGLLKVITEAISKVFTWLGDTIDKYIIAPLKALTDWLGWTANAAEESAQRQADAAKKVADTQKKYSEERIQQLNNLIRMSELEGKSTIQLEREKLQLLRETAKEQLNADRLAYQAAVRKGELSKEELENLKEVARQSRLTYRQAIEDVKFFEAQVKKERNDAEAERENKHKEELQKRYQESINWSKKLSEELRKLLQDEEMRNARTEEDRLTIQLERDRAELQSIYDKSAKTKEDRKNLNDALFALDREYFNKVIKLAEANELPIKILPPPEEIKEDFEEIKVVVEKFPLREALKTTKDSFKDFFKSFKEDLWGAIDELVAGIQNVAGQITNLLGQAFSQNHEERMFQLEQQYNTEIENLNSLLANRTISEEQYNDKLAEMEQQRTQAELSEKRKQFRRDKALNLVNAIMGTASGIAQSLPNLILAGISAAMGAAQIGIIASQQFTAARGGVVPGQPSMVDSVPSLLAPGEMVINSRSAQMFPQLLSDINQAGGGISLAPSVPNGGTGMTDRGVFNENNSDRVIRAYVVENEMTDKQKRVSRIERAAKFA